MNDLKIFTNPEFGSIRVIEKDGEPWFVATDVCQILDLTNPTMVLSRLDEDERSKLNLGRQGEANVVNEYGLYNLILGSRKPEAKVFKRWITHEVIPSIRKHGMYMTDEVLEKTLNNPDFLIDLLQAYKKEREEKLAYKEQVNLLVHAKKLYTTTEIAKELGFKSAQELNRDLERKRIQYKINNTWVLYSDYADKGYTSIKEQVLDNGKVIYDRKWTGLGRQFLLNLYNKKDRVEDIA